MWRKAWLEMRSRFLIGLVLAAIAAGGIVIDYRANQRLEPIARAIDPATLDTGGPLGQVIRESVEVRARYGYRGFVWLQWYRQNLSNLITVFAALLGAGGLISRAGGGSVAYTLSLPIARADLVTARSAVGLSQLLALAVVPSLLIPLVSQSIGESYSIVDVTAHGLCAFAAGAVFFSLATLLSTEFADIWRPILITCLVAMVLAIAEYVPPIAPYGLFRLMNGGTYFFGGTLPWAGLLLCAVISASLLWAAAVSLAHRDF